MRSLKIIFGLLVCVLLASAFETEVNGDNYIVGGRPATRHQFPWIVSLRSATNDHFCGGFILSDRWVGSAAHCTFGSRAVPANVIVASAAHTRFDGNRHRVARIVNHPRYNRQHMIFDISIIQTADRIPITPNGPVRTIRFPTGPVVHDGQTVFFAGWGLTGVSELASIQFILHTILILRRLSSTSQGVKVQLLYPMFYNGNRA